MKTNYVLCTHCRNCLILFKTANGSSSLSTHISTCFKPVVAQPTLPSFFQKVNADEKLKLRQAITEFIVSDVRTFNVVSGAGLKNLLIKAAAFGKKYTENLKVDCIPDSTTVSRDVYGLYDKCVEALQKFLVNAYAHNPFGLLFTSDIWLIIVI